jgi:hypothetical protein
MAAPESDERWVDRDFEQAVREVAYELWERDGHPEGQEKHYWFLAIEKCMHRRADEERIRRGLIDPM